MVDDAAAGQWADGPMSVDDERRRVQYAAGRGGAEVQRRRWEDLEAL